VADLEATEAAEVNEGLLADLAATDDAEEAADESDFETDAAETEATDEADEAEALMNGQLTSRTSLDLHSHSIGRGNGSGRDSAGSSVVGVRASRADSSGECGGTGSLDLLVLLLWAELRGGQKLRNVSLRYGGSSGVSTHLENLRKLLLGEADTAADCVSDSGEDLLDLVLSLDVVD
jgi:hypothetical protein